ncbi:MAG: transposase [Nitrospinaceae bacterium]|nr:transposase [Nitrospinaceae bacterium]
MSCKHKQAHIDKDRFKQIFRDHWTEFKNTSPRYNSLYYDEVINKMLDCGNPEKMGYAGFRCLSCGLFHTVAMSCKSTFCLSCAKPYTDSWIDFIGRRLIPGVVYRHTVLTVPDFLRIYFYRDRSLLDPFMRLAQPCLKDLFKTAFGLELDIGLVVVLQTFGRPGNYNVHLHIITSSGGVTKEGKWKAISFIPYDILHRKWQYHLLNFMKEHLPQTPSVKRDIDRGWKQFPKGFVAHIQKGEVPQGGKGIAKYLAKYVVSPPISVRRIEMYDGINVRYWYNDHKSGKIQHETIPALLFIGRMVQHILPKGFQRIRYYGFHSNVNYEQMQDKIRQLMPHKQPTDPLGYRVMPRKSFQLLFWETFGKNPLTCPSCGDTMQLECLWHPKYGFIADMMHSYSEYQDTG